MFFEILPQLLLNGLIAGALYALLALGLTIIYGILKFVNFAHGEIAMTSGYAFLVFHIFLGWPIIPSFIIAIAAVIILGIIIEYSVFLPVKNSPPLISLIISIGLGILLRNLVLIIFGPNVHNLHPLIKTYSLFGGKLIITQVHIAVISLTLICFIFLFLFLKKSKIGIAIRAASENKEMAAILGINVTKIITLIFIISMALAGVGGIMVAFDQNLNPNMGTFLSLKAFAATILGGLGNIPGAVLGGFFIGFAENILIAIPFGDFYIPSGYKDAIAFVALILILYLKPTGLLGEKKEEIIRK